MYVEMSQIYVSNYDNLDRSRDSVASRITSYRVLSILDEVPGRPETRVQGPWVGGEHRNQRTLSWGSSSDMAIHERFAQLSYTPQSVLDFSKRYSLLCDSDHEVEATNWPLEVVLLDDEESVAVYEPVKAWYSEIYTIKACLRLLPLARSSVANFNQSLRDEMRSFVDRESHQIAPIQNVFFDHFSMVWGTPRSTPELDDAIGKIEQAFGKLRKETLDQPERIIPKACYHLQTQINRNLQVRATPLVPARPGFPLRLHTTTLLGALYVSLARQFAGETALTRICKGCGQPFTPLHGRQEHCGTSCRVKTYRRNRAQKEANNGN